MSGVSGPDTERTQTGGVFNWVGAGGEQDAMVRPRP
jgi:hypothetical protein